MIPKDWSGINIKQFVQLYPTFKIGDMTNTEIIDNKIKQLSIIKGISLKEAELCTTIEANKVKLLMETELPTRIRKHFKINGITYRFNINANELDSSGYVGIMNSIKDDPIRNMHATMFNLATPVKYSWLRAKFIPYEFKPSEVEERMEDFKRMPINIAYPIGVFFLNLSKNLIPVTEDYLRESLMKMNQELKETKEDLLSMDGQ